MRNPILLLLALLSAASFPCLGEEERKPHTYMDVLHYDLMTEYWFDKEENRRRSFEDTELYTNYTAAVGDQYRRMRLPEEERRTLQMLRQALAGVGSGQYTNRIDDLELRGELQRLIKSVEADPNPQSAYEIMSQLDQWFVSEKEKAIDEYRAQKEAQPRRHRESTSPEQLADTERALWGVLVGIILLFLFLVFVFRVVCKLHLAWALFLAVKITLIIVAVFGRLSLLNP